MNWGRATFAESGGLASELRNFFPEAIGAKDQASVERVADVVDEFLALFILE